MSEQVIKVAIESAVLAFIPIWAETGGATAVEDWRDYFGKLCRKFVRERARMISLTIWTRRAQPSRQS